jgi:Fe-S-cluster containining protein
LAVCATGKANEEDISRWENEGRFDILWWVSILPIFDIGEERFADLWINPETGEDANRCPFLRKVRNQNKYRCLIQDTKPEYCRQYPQDEEFAGKSGCPGSR